MRKIIFALILIIISSRLFFVSANNRDREAGHSASISYKKILYISSNNIELSLIDNPFFYKKYAIKKVLERYNSPLFDSVDDFIKVCLDYQINCYFLPAIAGLESTFGHYILPNSFNPFGWGGGYIIFKNWADGIEKVGQGLKNNYLNRGLKTIEEIGTIYSENPTWAVRVRFFITQFEKEEENLRLYFEKNEVKL